MARGAQAAIGAGGGNPMGLYVSSHILHESTVTTSDPVLDMDSNVSFFSPVTHDHMMVVNPFKSKSGLKLADHTVLTPGCNYLQTSMPSESSGLISNTGVICVPDEQNTFRFVRRDQTPVMLPRITPAVLCSDASSNLLDVFSRADIVLEKVNIRFGYMPELIIAIADIKNMSTTDLIKEMVARSNLSSSPNDTVDPKNGDIVITNGVFPDLQNLSMKKSPKWGGNDSHKLHATNLHSFIVANPLASASVNGVPITTEGLALSEEKHKWAAGISNESEIFGAGCIGSGAIKAAAESRLASDLEPSRKGWIEVVKLQHNISAAATHIENTIKKSNKQNISKPMADAVTKIHEQYQVIKECKKVLQTHTSMLVATSDLITGGYAGNPSTAMVSPIRPEMLGIIGALSTTSIGFGVMMGRKEIDSVNSALLGSLTLSSSGGKFIPEHGGCTYIG
uniref:Capsid protein n=1 Tax=Chionoecetes opilio bacilliform virus TaxID=1825681 RepID=A0A1Q3DL69_9VIRU|nr:capsid protein [Chionoecetes opilio bacilliform virus]